MHIENNHLRTNYYYSPNPQRRPATKPKPSRRGLMPLMLASILILSVIIFAVRAQSSDEAGATSPNPQSPAAAQIPPEPAKNITSDAEMAAVINEAISASPDIDISVSIISLDNNKSYHYGLDANFDQASVAKLLTAITYLHKVEKKEASLQTQLGEVTAQQNIQKMIETSDNVAWKNLNDYITHEYLLAYMQSHGITTYSPQTNTIDSNSVAKLLAKLYKGKLLNQKNTQILLGYMKNANRTDLVIAKLPNGVSAYHKAGWLEDRNHDAVIIDDKYDPYVLVIFTNGHRKYHPIDAATIIHKITHATVERFISKQ